MNKSICCMLSMVLAGVLGCGSGDDGPQRVPVSGEVTFDGTPISEGDIIFRPASGSGVPDAGKIKDGKFEFEAVPGKYRVEIEARKNTAEDSKLLPSGEAAGELEQYIPKQYNEESTLTAEVTESGENTFTFPLKSK